MDEAEDENGGLVTDKMIKALVLLEERKRAIGERLERIEARLRELDSEEKKEKEELSKANLKKAQASPRGYKCKMGRAILALGILGVLMSVGDARAEEPKMGTKSAYGGLQGLLEGVALGIQERQLKMEEMNKNMSVKQ
jgi:hypothetical protein